MKKCIKCSKESEGNFCVFCGGKLVEEITKSNYRENGEFEKYSNGKQLKNIFIPICMVAMIIIIAIGSYISYSKITELNSQITTLNSEVNSLKKKNTDLEKENKEYKLEKIDYQNTIDFFNENIVFVLDGYGKYYYTYEQVQQVTQGKEYYYWAYNKEQAINLGYRAWK